MPASGCGESAGQDRLDSGGHVAARIGQHEDGNALPDRHGGEGHDDRRQAEARDHHAVEGAGAKPDQDRQREAGNRVRADGQRHHGTGDARHRAERQIDAASQDDDELAERDQGERHCVDGERTNIERRVAPLERDDDDEEAAEDQHRPVVADLEAPSRGERHDRPPLGFQRRPPRRGRCGRQ